MPESAAYTHNVTSLKSAPNIFRRLSTGVIGQQTGKRDLSSLLAMHLKWTELDDGNFLHTAPNALIVGPTGVGKTHAIRTAARALAIPLAIADSTRLASTSFSEETLEGVLVELLRASRRLIKRQYGDDSDDPAQLEELTRAQQGIVFLDEFDKLAVRSTGRDDKNELVQRRLLQFIDGATVTLPAGRHTGESEMVFETGGLLFVVAGAFTDLLTTFGGRPHHLMRGMQRHDHVIPEDIVRYGFMRELIARIPVLIEFNPLSRQELAEILADDAIAPSHFYVQYLRSLGTELSIDESARQIIAARAEELEVGARGLHQVLFPILSLLSQEIEDMQERPASVELDAAAVLKLAQKVEDRRNARNK